MVSNLQFLRQDQWLNCACIIVFQKEPALGQALQSFVTSIFNGSITNFVGWQISDIGLPAHIKKLQKEIFIVRITVALSAKSLYFIFSNMPSACPPCVVPAFRHKQCMNLSVFSFFFSLFVLYSTWGHQYTTEHGVVSGERSAYPEFLYVPSSFSSTNNWDLESVHLSFKMSEPLCSEISLFAWMTVNADVLFFMLSFLYERG